MITQLPFDQRAAIANSGWRMDSPENIVAVPGDRATYRALPNDGFLPYHSGPHPRYDAVAAAMLRTALAGVNTSSALEVKAALADVEEQAFGLLVTDRTMHERIN